MGCGDVDDTAPADPPGTTRIEFRAMVGDLPFRCGQRYPGIGTSGSSVEGVDFRLYVHDVQLVRADGTRVPFQLVPDGRFQSGSIALLDFEDGSAACETGSPETHTSLLGRAPAGAYTGIAFKLGVPQAQNHLNAPSAPAPLNIPGLWWSWSGGYKFARIDMRSTGNRFYYFHLGATTCLGSVAMGFSCAYGNRPEIVVNGMDPTRNAIRLDLRSLYAGVDVDRRPDGMTDNIAGCMAFAGDPECPAMFGALGMAFTDRPQMGTAQTMFSAMPRTP